LSVAYSEEFSSEDRSTLIIIISIVFFVAFLTFCMWRYSSVLRVSFQHNIVDADKSPSSRLASLSSSRLSSLASGLDSPQQICPLNILPPISPHLLIELDDPNVVFELSQLDDPEVDIEWSS
jgi:hypothetical protein